MSRVLSFTILGVSEFSSHASITSLFRAQSIPLPQQQFSFSIQPYMDQPVRQTLGSTEYVQREKCRDSSVSLETDISYLSLPGYRGRQLSSVGSYNSSFRRNNFSMLHPVVEDVTDSRPSSHDRLVARRDTSSVDASSSALLPAIVSSRTTPKYLRPMSTYSDIPSISPTLDSRFTKRTWTQSTLTVPTILSSEYKTITLAKPQVRAALHEVSDTHSQSALPIREVHETRSSVHSHRHISCHSLSTPTRICPSLTHHSLPDLIDDDGSHYTTATSTPSSSSTSSDPPSTPTPPPPSWYPKSLKHRPLTSDPAIKRLTNLVSYRLSSDLQHTPRDPRNTSQDHLLDPYPNQTPGSADRGSPPHRRTSLHPLSLNSHEKRKSRTRDAGKNRKKRIWEEEATTPLPPYISRPRCR